MELYIPMSGLERFAQDAADAMTVRGTVNGKREAAAMRRALRTLGQAEARKDGGAGAQRWLRDNLYLVRQAAAEAIPAFRAAGRLRAAQGRALIVRAAEALLASGDGDADAERIEGFLLAFQTRLPLTGRELGLVPAALRLTLAERLALLYSSPEPEEHRAEVLFTALRRLGMLELALILERADPVDRLLRQDPAEIYARMDEDSRRDYRRRVGYLAAKLSLTETETAEKALALAAAGASSRTRHVGFYLFERPLGRRRRQPDGLGYSLVNLTLPALLAVLTGAALRSVWAAGLVWLPLSELVKRAVDRRLLSMTPTRNLPSLELREGVPPKGKTLCVISLLLVGEAAVERAVRRLEEFRMAERACGENLLFGLVCDLPESREFLRNSERELLVCAAGKVEALNDRLGGGFFLFTRDRCWSRADRRFRPWERKRGAVLELCRLLAGDATSMKLSAGDISELRDTRYLLTLDSDTRPEPDCARVLIGTALHPLNRPVVDKKRGVVVLGHGILQPRLSVDLTDAFRSDFARFVSPSGGIDPYGADAGEVYMDRFRSGGFAGKGLIHIQSYLDCLSRLPAGEAVSSGAQS